MRLFIAVNFDEPTKGRILDVQGRLREVARGRFSLPENLHLTLVFLGEIEPARVADVRRAMEGVAVKPMTLRFNGVGRFRRDGGDLWWIGLEEEPALLRLQKDLSERLRAEGFAIESRRFSPHITLAREVRLRGEPDRNELLGGDFSACADHISLMLSERINGKLTYTELYRVPPGSEAFRTQK